MPDGRKEVRNPLKLKYFKLFWRSLIFIRDDVFAKPLSIFLIIISLLSFTSCIEEIDMTTFEHDPKLVVNSLFSADSNFYVRVSKSTGIGSEFEYPNLYVNDSSYDPEWGGLNGWYCDAVKVDNPIVEIWENGTYVKNLLEGEYGLFYSENLSPQPNNVYEIKVSAPGFETVLAKDSVPEKIEITNIEFAYVGDCFGDDSHYTKINIEFVDPPGLENYYEILCPNPNYVYYSDNRGLINTVGYMELKTDDAVLLAENENNYMHGFVFSDKIIDGHKNVRTIYVRQFLDNMNYEEFELNIELRSISYQYYQYRQKMHKYLEYRYSGHDLESFYKVGEPVIMFTNVVNGRGVFVAYSSDIKTITYP